MSLVPPIIPLLSSILKAAGIEMELFDTTLYNATEKQVNADDYKEKIMAVKPFSKLLHEKVGELYDIKKLDEDLIKKITSFSPDLIMTTATESSFLYTIEMLKKIKHFGIPVLLGGVFASFASEKAISYDEIDMVCIGEAEKMIVPLCQYLQEHKDPSGLPNLWFKKTDGTIAKGPLSTPADINKNPLVDMSIFDDRRFYRAMAGKIYRMFPVETHRGCPHVCAFCNSPLQNKLYREKTHSNYFRVKTIPLVMEEIRYYFNQFRAEYLYFWADNFMMYSDKEIDEFCEAYKEIKLPFYAQSHPDQLSDYKIKKLKEVGLHRVGLGIEHGNEEFRRRVVNRFYSNEKLLEGVKILHKYDVPFSANNICGFPTETPELVMDTVELNRKLKAHTNSCSIFTPFHGTPLRELSVKLGYLKDPDIIAGTNTEISILDMPQFTKEQIFGKARTFNMYVHLPENRWPDIARAEKMTPEGDKIWQELKREYQEKAGD
jgi:anaerobic magnesium-protoporphyrin IX monomethyl ester cyclase